MVTVVKMETNFVQDSVTEKPLRGKGASVDAAVKFDFDSASISLLKRADMEAGVGVDVGACSLSGILEQMMTNGPGVGKVTWRQFWKNSKRQQEKLHEIMQGFAHGTDLPGVVLFVQVNKRNMGNWTLRWRTRLGRYYTYVTFETAQERLFPEMTASMQRYYVDMDRVLRELNTTDSMLQHQISFAKRLVN